VVELTGDFTLTLPVMLAVAIASTVSRMLSYGTIYTTKLLRRGGFRPGRSGPSPFSG
jgi:CIC family chloride channel protein